MTTDPSKSLHLHHQGEHQTHDSNFSFLLLIHITARHSCVALGPHPRILCLLIHLFWTMFVVLRVGVLSWAAPGSWIKRRKFYQSAYQHSPVDGNFPHVLRCKSTPSAAFHTPKKANKYDPPRPLAYSIQINSLRCVSVGVSQIITYHGSSICISVVLWMVSVSLFNTMGECEGWESYWCFMCSHVEVFCFASSCVSVLWSPDKFQLKV